MRIDKWLWAARFYKTRSLAQQAIAGSRVRVNDERVKPAHDLRVGDSVVVRVGEYEWRIKVRALSERRGPAAEARRLYESLGFVEWGREPRSLRWDECFVDEFHMALELKRAAPPSS